MSRPVLSWLSKSFSRKIGGLSTTLLAFIMIVILYSIVKLQEISMEMREEAEIDIPLTDVISEFGVLQLEQHILLEQIRHAELDATSLPEQRNTLIAKYKKHANDIAEQLNRAETIINDAITRKQLVDEVAEHQRLLTELKRYWNGREAFNGLSLNYLTHPS